LERGWVVKEEERHQRLLERSARLEEQERLAQWEEVCEVVSRGSCSQVVQSGYRESVAPLQILGEQQINKNNKDSFEIGSPSHKKLADDFKLCLSQSFCKCVRALLSGLDALDHNPLFNANLRSTEMTFQTEVLVPSRH